MKMKKTLLVIAGIGALVAILGGFGGITLLIGLGGGAMVISLLLLPWVNEPSSVE